MHPFIQDGDVFDSPQGQSMAIHGQVKEGDASTDRYDPTVGGGSTNLQHEMESTDNLFITGLGTAQPEHIFDASGFEDYVRTIVDEENPLIQKLFRVNRNTGVDTRACLDPRLVPEFNTGERPSIDTQDKVYRKYATELAVRACRQAISEAHLEPSDITHMIAVTATNAGSPGFDLYVMRDLGIPGNVPRTIMMGVGCAGGLSCLRTAAEVCSGCTGRNRPGRVLVFATELTSQQLRGELERIIETGNFGIGPALFGDGSAAVVLENKISLAKRPGRSIYSLSDWSMDTVPDTEDVITYQMYSKGFVLNLPPSVPGTVVKPAVPALQRLTKNLGLSADPSSFEWALHPGGLKITKSFQSCFGLEDELLRSTHHTYRTQGNTASVGVLVVLDDMRKRKPLRENVVAASIGPGLIFEMAILKRMDFIGETD